MKFSGTYISMVHAYIHIYKHIYVSIDTYVYPISIAPTATAITNNGT